VFTANCFIAKPGFNALDFVLYCARKGKVRIGRKDLTLLVAPMSGFYLSGGSVGRTMMRVAYVETPDRMALVPELFAALLGKYVGSRV